jgi:hypothetical protein
MTIHKKMGTELQESLLRPPFKRRAPPSREVASKTAITQMITYHTHHDIRGSKDGATANRVAGTLLPVCGTSENEIAEHGTGLGVYFASVRWIACYLLFACLANMPGLWLDHNGSYRDRLPRQQFDSLPGSDAKTPTLKFSMFLDNTDRLGRL